MALTTARVKGDDAAGPDEDMVEHSGTAVRSMGRIKKKRGPGDLSNRVETHETRGNEADETCMHSWSHTPATRRTDPRRPHRLHAVPRDRLPCSG